MAVLGAEGTVLCGHVAVGILKGGQRLVNPWLQRVDGRLPAVPDAHVHHVERLGTEVLGHLQILMEACLSAVPDAHVHHVERLGTEVLSHLQVLMEANAVGGAVAPVHVPVAGTFLDGADGAFPAEGVLRRDLSLDETAAGEAHELRAHLVEHLCQVGAQAVLAVLPCWREEAHHVELQGALAVEDQGEPGLRVVAVGCQLGGVLRPSLPFVPRGGHDGFGVEVLAVEEAGLDGALIVALGPETEPVGTALHGIDTPEAFVLKAHGVGRRGVDGQFEGVLLGAVQQFYFLGGLHEAGVDGRAVEAVGLPALHVGGSAVARAVLE